MSSSQWFVYMLRCADESLYIGISTDVDRRLAVHAAGKGAKYTRARLPVICVWRESAVSESQARKREAALKRLTRQQKLLLLK